MYIATNELTKSHESIIRIMPQSVRRAMYSINLDEAEEIRIIQGKSVYIRYTDGDYYITASGRLTETYSGGIRIEKKHIDEMLERITKSSLYSVADELKNGYITIDGGHRVGVVGTGVVNGGRVEFIKNISALNIRIANEVIGCSDMLMKDIVSDGLGSTLIISPPGCGKTTLLRDIARNLSDSGYTVAIADERCEISAMFKGESMFELGTRTVVLENCPKAYAMTSLLRSMSPDCIITDELGDDADITAVAKIINSGVSIIASAHGKDIETMMRKKAFKKLIPMFDTVIALSKRNGVGTVERITHQC